MHLLLQKDTISNQAYITTATTTITKKEKLEKKEGNFLVGSIRMKLQQQQKEKRKKKEIIISWQTTTTTNFSRLSQLKRVFVSLAILKYLS